MRLHRYWFEFDLVAEGSPWAHGVLGCGVTAWVEEDAGALLREHVFDGADLPPIWRIIKDIDISTLDGNHICPNLGVPVWRGVWYPRRG